MTVKVKLLSLSDSLRPVDCSPPGSSVHGILQARLLEWVAISFSRGSSRPRDRTQVSRIAGRCFNLWATGELRYTNYYTAVLLLFSRSGYSSLCDPMDCSTPRFPVLHHLQELAQTHVRWVGDSIQLSHTLLSPSPPAFNLSQHQGLF